MPPPMNRGDGVKATHTGRDVLEYTTAAVDLDLTLGPDGTWIGDAVLEPRLCFVLSAAAGKKLHINADSGVARTLSADLWAGKPVPFGVLKVLAASDSGIVLGIIW